jgi:hypothetical protein
LFLAVPPPPDFRKVGEVDVHRVRGAVRKFQNGFHMGFSYFSFETEADPKKKITEPMPETFSC